MQKSTQNQKNRSVFRENRKTGEVETLNIGLSVVVPTVRFISTVTKVNFKKSMKKCLKVREIFTEVRIHPIICRKVVFSLLNHAW